LTTFIEEEGKGKGGGKKDALISAGGGEKRKKGTSGPLVDKTRGGE